MNMQADLLTRISAVDGLSALGTRIAWFERPRKSKPEFPALVVTFISPGRDWTHAGPDELDRPRLQFDLYGPSPDALLSLFAALRTELERMPHVDVGTTRFHPAALDSQRDMPPEDLADDTRIFGISADFHFYHEPV